LAILFAYREHEFFFASQNKSKKRATSELRQRCSAAPTKTGLEILELDKMKSKEIRVSSTTQHSFVWEPRKNEFKHIP
jgi:hypothetical protein